MRMISGAILLAAAAVCTSIAALASGPRDEVGYTAAFISGALGLALMVAGFIAERRGKGNGS